MLAAMFAAPMLLAGCFGSDVERALEEYSYFSSGDAQFVEAVQCEKVAPQALRTCWVTLREELGGASGLTVQVPGPHQFEDDFRVKRHLLNRVEDRWAYSVSTSFDGRALPRKEAAFRLAKSVSAAIDTAVEAGKEDLAERRRQAQNLLSYQR